MKIAFNVSFISARHAWPPLRDLSLFYRSSLETLRFGKRTVHLRKKKTNKSDMISDLFATRIGGHRHFLSADKPRRGFTPFSAEARARVCVCVCVCARVGVV